MIAPDNIDQRTAENFTGKDVRGPKGNYIGSVADVIVDSQSGRIAFFAVSSGGVAGIGDTLRLVPYAALSRSTNDDGFTVSVTEAQWDRMPAINEREFEAGRINVTADRERQWADRGGSSAKMSDRRAENHGDIGQRLARAEKLRGMAVRADNHEIGEIEAIVLDLDRGTATALMDTDEDFARADGNYLVPLKHFQFTADRDALTTTLAATDFPKAFPAADRDAVAGTATAAHTDRVATDVHRTDAYDTHPRTTAQNRDGDEHLTPTGRDGNKDLVRGVDPALQSAARSVRQIWDAHADLAKLDLRVTAERGRLIFRGSVPNADLWERAKDTAEGVVRGIEIENHISIGNRDR